MWAKPLTCRASGDSEIIPILSLGDMPLANALLTADQLSEREARYPLDLVFAPESALVQITETVPPELLFGEYLYFSSFSDTMLDHAEGLVERLVAERGLGGDSMVVEVASNDGYLLQYYRDRAIPMLGIEPARNVARVAEERGIPTRSLFFSEAVACELKVEGVVADVIHANNVLAHVADLNGVVRGLRTLLRHSGVAVIEVPYVKELIDRCEFDTIYHEHLCYFSLTALDRLFQRHDLILEDVERIPIHGGSLRVFAAPGGGGRTPSGSVQAMLAEEAAWGAGQPDFYLDFGRRVEDLRKALLTLLRGLKSGGKRLAAYGAAAKGSTLLNYCGIGLETLDFVADRSTYKQGMFMPGVHVPVVPTERLVEEMPDCVLLLAWNLAEEIMHQQAEYRRKGGRFIVPVPEPRII